MMNETINTLTALLNRYTTTSTLVTVTAKGEELRRRIARLSAHGRVDPVASSLLARYDTVLPFCQPLFVPAEGMINFVGIAARAITDYAGMRPSSRSEEEGEKVLVEFEEALAYAQAGVRVAAYSERAVESIVRMVNEILWKHAPQLPDLWEFAESRARELDCSGPYTFTARLAKLGPNNLTLRV